MIYTYIHIYIYVYIIYIIYIYKVGNKPPKVYKLIKDIK